MNRLRCYILTVILLLGVLPEGATQPLPIDWRGDTERLTIDEGRMRIAPIAGSTDRAELRGSYTVTPGEALSWGIECHYDKRPSQYNTFRWDLFCEEAVDGTYTYTLRPDSRGYAVELVRSFSPTSSLKKPREEVLLSQRLSLPDEEWRMLYLRVDYDGRGTLTLRQLTPESGVGPYGTARTLGGRLMGETAIRVRYTSGRMREVWWTAPLVRGGEVPRSPEVLSTGYLKGGQVRIRLDQPVDRSEAVALVSGKACEVQYGETLSSLLVDASSIEGEALQLRLSGLRTLSGEMAEVTTTVERKAGESAPDGRLLITEIMIKPPTVGPLARVQYIELYNDGKTSIDLSRIVLLYRKSKFPLPSYTLRPGSYVVLCPSDPSLDLKSLGSALPLASFPALSGSFPLALQSSEGAIYDRVEVGAELMEPGLEDEGRSLELVSIDPPQWRLSQDYKGGTPGEPSLMRPYEGVKKGELVINEILLSPETTGEKFLELFNSSSHPIELESVYLRYRNLPTSSASSWALTTGPYTLGVGEYVVLTPFPPALERLHPITDPSTFVERIDFPSLSPTYTEMELISRADRSVVDKAIYRRQWLGDTSKDRSHHSLERISPKSDGTRRSSWRRSSDASEGGTPGRPNSVSGSADGYEWPEDPSISYEQLRKLLPLYSELATLELYDLSGQQVYRCRGEAVLRVVDRLKRGLAPLPTMICVIRITIAHPSEDFPDLIYSGRWLHSPAM